MNTVTCTIEILRVNWSKPDGSWVITRAMIDPVQDLGVAIPQWLVKQGKIPVVGPLGSVGEGDLLDVQGEIIEDPKWGRQLKVTVAERCIRASDRAIQAFLRGFASIGHARSALITKHFGGFEGVMDVLDNDPARLTEVTGIGSELAAKIADGYAQAWGRRDALIFTNEMQFPQRMAAKIIDHFGGKARAAITADPYILMELRGVPFGEADRIATTKFSVTADDPRRTAAAAGFVLTTASGEGHVFSTISDLIESESRQVKAAFAATSMSAELLQQGLHVLSEPRQVGDYSRSPSVVIIEDRYYPAYLRHAELIIAANLAQRLQGANV